jgi:hypothetical protein
MVLVGLVLGAITVGPDAAAGRVASHRRASASHGQSSGMIGSGASSSSHVVRGYVTKRGTHVASHRQTNPDHTQRNNYSTKGNVNPSNGKLGTNYAKH